MNRKQQHNQRHKQQTNLNKKKPKNTINNIVKYSGLSFQMLAIILLFVFGGKELDKYVEWETPIFTLLLSLLGVFLAIYSAIKDFLKK